MRRSGVVVVVALLVTATWPGLATASVNGEPELDLALADSTVAPGEETTLSLVLTNDADLGQVSLTNPQLADRVTTAKGVSVTVDSGDAPLTVESGEQLLGSIADGGRTTAAVDVTVDEDANPGTYELDVDVEYSHASSVSDQTGAVSQNSVDRSFDVEVIVEPDDVRFRVVDTDTAVRAGESGTFTATVEQTGQEVARNVRLQLRSLDPAVTPAGSGEANRYVGNWSVGERRAVRYHVTASPDASGTQHTLELVPTYENAYGDGTTGQSLAVGLTPIAGARFHVHNAYSTAPSTQPTVDVGGRVSVDVGLRNRGPGAAENVSVRLAATSPVTTVDGGSAADRAVGRVTAGNRQTVSFDVGAKPSGHGGNYTFAATVTYDDPTGNTVTSRAWPVAVRVRSPPSLSLITNQSSVYVGERGTVSGTVTNDGGSSARNAVLRVTESPAGIQFTETSVPLGDLAPGEHGSFSLPAHVPSETTAGPRAVTYALEYETADGTVVTSAPLRANTQVQSERDTFEVSVENGTVAPDSTEELVVTLTNAGETTREDVRATIAPTPPFTSPAPSVYVGTLAPGESATVRFPVETDEDAVTAGHAIAVNVTADTDTGLTERERHRLAIDVATESGPVDTMPLVVMGGLSLTLLAGVGYWWTKRR